MAYRFIAHPPGNQDADTFRQFQQVQRALEDLESRIIDNLILGFLIPNYTFSAHGTMFNTAPVIGPDIGTGWSRVTAFDTISSANRITFDTTADTWTYENSGVYQVSVEIILSHGESNSGRQFSIRLNDGSGTGNGVPVSVGRNQPGSNIAVSFLQDIAVGDPNRTFSLEVGDGDAISGVIWEATSITVVNVGAWIDEAPV